MMKPVTRQIVAAILAACPLAAAAEPVAEGDETIDTIVTTGTRIADLLSDIPNSTTVIDLGDIEAANRATVLDILRNVPGLQVTQPGGRGGIASVFIRGGEPNFTMVLLDGVRVNDPNNTRGGSFDFSILSVGDIQRIEIVRGPQSAIYGSDALSGVINIITRRGGEESGATLHAEVGEDDYRRAGLLLSGPAWSNGGYALRVATVDDGHATPGNTHRSDSVAGKLDFGSPDAVHFGMFARWSDNEGTSFPEDSGGPELAVLPLLDVKSSTDLSAGITGGLRLTDRWSVNALVGFYDHEDRYDSPGVAPGLRDPVPPNGALSNLDRRSISVHASGELGETLRVTFGADHHAEEGVSDGYVELFPGFRLPSGFALDRSVTGVFGELRYRPADALSLLASLRHDDPEGEEGVTTTKLGALYDLADGRTTLRANWGEGFKLPSFFALGSPLIGNPDLAPEKSESMDVGVTRRFDGGAATTLTVYRNEFTDLIDFDFELFTSVNRSSVTAKGAELGLEWPLRPDLEVFAEVAWLDLDVKDTDVPLRQRPEWRGSVAVRWAVSPDWQLDAAWLLVGETFDSSVPTDLVTLGGYGRLDATVTWRANERMDWVLSADNLLDADYEEAVGFPSPGRRGRLALRYRF